MHPCSALALTGLGALCHHVAAEGDVSSATRLQRDGMRVEVAQHVKDGLEPEVLHVALPALVQRQPQVLQGQGAGGETNPCNLQEPPPSAKGGLLLTPLPALLCLPCCRVFPVKPHLLQPQEKFDPSWG